jgi:hypothetical protein
MLLVSAAQCFFVEIFSGRYSGQKLMRLVAAMTTASPPSTIAAIPPIAPVKYSTPTDTANSILTTLSIVPMLVFMCSSFVSTRIPSLFSIRLCDKEPSNDHRVAKSSNFHHMVSIPKRKRRCRAWFYAMSQTCAGRSITEAIVVAIVIQDIVAVITQLA